MDYHLIVLSFFPVRLPFPPRALATSSHLVRSRRDLTSTLRFSFHSSSLEAINKTPSVSFDHRDPNAGPSLLHRRSYVLFPLHFVPRLSTRPDSSFPLLSLPLQPFPPQVPDLVLLFHPPALLRLLDLVVTSRVNEALSSTKVAFSYFVLRSPPLHNYYSFYIPPAQSHSTD